MFFPNEDTMIFLDVGRLIFSLNKLQPFLPKIPSERGRLITVDFFIGRNRIQNKITGCT
jgi:hypothetical protein